MYTFKLSRTEIHKQSDTTILIGYNYYLLCLLNGELATKRLIYTSVLQEQSTDQFKHDLEAGKIYQDFLKGKVKATPQEANKLSF